MKFISKFIPYYFQAVLLLKYLKDEEGIRII